MCNKDIIWVHDSFCVHMNVWPYLEEVQTYLTISICVEGLKGFCRNRNKGNQLNFGS